MPQPKYGSREGLADRLDKWAEQLATDKRYPWIGTGIIADLKAASAVISGKPEAPKPVMEFDL